jgi:hypothetical protein
MAARGERKARSRSRGGMALGQALNSIGASSPLVVAILLLIFLAHEIWVTRIVAAIDTAFAAWSDRPVEYVFLWGLVVAVVVGAAFALALYIKRTAGGHFEIDCTPPTQRRALAVLLSKPSPPPDDPDAAARAALSQAGGSIDDPAARARIQSNWRMPIEAIAFHLGRVERVVLITSKESAPHADAFRRCLEQMGATAHGVRVQTAAELVGDAVRAETMAFDDVRHLDDVIERVYTGLGADGYPPGEILFDLTGGTKIATATVATAVTVHENRQFQYVDTTDYRVWTYNVTFSRDS